jgi:hypothetical protein
MWQAPDFTGPRSLALMIWFDDKPDLSGAYLLVRVIRGEGVVGVLRALFRTGDGRWSGGGGAGGVVGGMEGVRLRRANGWVDSSARQPGVLDSSRGRGFGVLWAPKGRRDVLVLLLGVWLVFGGVLSVLLLSLEEQELQVSDGLRFLGCCGEGRGAAARNDALLGRRTSLRHLAAAHG